jgi:hypothetical protein
MSQNKAELIHMYYAHGSQDVAVRILAILQAEASGSFLFRDREFFSSPSPPVLLWDLPCQLCNEHWRLFHVTV